MSSRIPVKCETCRYVEGRMDQYPCSKCNKFKSQWRPFDTDIKYEFPPTCAGCLNFSGPTHCHALNKRPSDKTCFARIEDFDKYTETLEKCIGRMRENGHHNYHPYIDQLKEVYELVGLPFPGEPVGSSHFGLYSAYLADKKRGSGGGKSENGSSDRNNPQIMKDNRALETKWTKGENVQIREETEKFELEHGKLERLGRTSMSNSKVDSYTGDEIC